MRITTLEPSMRMSRLLAVLFVFSACEGNATVPDPADAMPDAELCPCPPAQRLLAEHITRQPLMRLTDYGFVSHSCVDGGYLLGVGCAAPGNDSRLALVGAGFDVEPTGDGSICHWDWYNPNSLEDVFTNTAICLADDLVPPDNSDSECDCPPIEPLLQRVSRVELSQSLAAQSYVSLLTGCVEDDAVLVAGGCSIEPFPGMDVDHDIRLNVSGLAGSKWRCTWANSLVDRSFTITTTAVCIRPPAPSTAPEDQRLADRVIQVVEEQRMPANSTLAFSAACAPGDYLISGSCTLDSMTDNTIALYDHGFEPGGNNPNAWRCAWWNPGSTNPTAQATAVCLTPPAL